MSKKQTRYVLFSFYIIVLVLVSYTLIVFSAQKSQNSQKIKQITQQKEIMAMPTFTEKDNGGEYYLSLDEPFRVVLNENPTTGYRWVIDKSTSPGLVLINEIYTARESNQPKVGGGGIKNMIFKTTERGPSQLVLYLRRPWEPEGKYIDSFNLSLEIE